MFARGLRTVVGSVVVAAAVAVAGCGGSGGSDTQFGVGTITITGFVPGTIPGGNPVAFTVIGVNFETVAGTTALVTFRAVGGETPFAGGTSDSATVLADVTSDTTIEGTTPPIVVCGVASVELTVQVTIESGVKSNVFGGAGEIVVPAPTVTGAIPASVPALDPGSIVVTGTGFGPVGSPAVVRFVADGGIYLFGAGTLTETEVVGTVTSTTTISVADVPIATVCGAVTRTAGIQVTLEGGSCSALAGGALTYERPEATSFATSGTGGGPGIARQTLPNAFTITGGVYAQVGDPVVVRFVTSGPDAGLAAFEGGASDTAEVFGVVASSTTVTGTTPVAVGQSANFQATATVYFGNGACTGGVTVTFVAPPMVTDVIADRRVFFQGSPGVTHTNRFLECVSVPARVIGTSFVTGASVTFFETAVGPTAPIGTTGALGSSLVVNAGLITGTSPTDDDLVDLTQVTVRVVNPDGQSGDFTPVLYSVNDALANVDATPVAGTNAEMSVSVNPANPRNGVVASHTSGFASIRCPFTTDHGATWTQVLVGAAQDGFPAGAFRFDPMGAFDRFGNFYVTYIADDGRTLPDGSIGTRSLLVVQSQLSGGSAGATYQPAVVLATETYIVDSTGEEPGPGIDRCTIATGLEPASGGEAIYVAFIDLNTGRALINGAPCTGAAVALGGTFTGTAIPSPGPPLGPFLVDDGAFFSPHAAPSVGPSGELHVTWADGAAVAPDVSRVMHDLDFDGLASATFGFGLDVEVAQTGMPGRTYGFIVAMNNRGHPLIPPNVTILSGGQGGRCVVAYTDVEPPIVVVESPSPQPNTRVVTQFSDDFGASWSAKKPVHTDNLLHQFHTWIATDPVQGDLYVTWYDTTDDPVPGRNRQTRRLSAVSHDGGVSWSDSLILSQGLSDAGIVAKPAPPASPVSGANDYLEYNGVSVWNGCVWANWADNSNVDGNNPNGTQTVDGFDSMVTIYMQR